MRVVVTGATGFIGRYVVEDCLAHGYPVVAAGRTTPSSRDFSRPVTFVEARLSAATDWGPVVDGADAIVHAAFEHLPGRYRGGEGDDPGRFQATNLDGTLSLFEAAKAAGVRRLVFLSSRAVLGDGPAQGPDSLYGELKLEAEQALAAMRIGSFAGLTLRLTGVYGPAGPGRKHKWNGLFSDYLEGRPIEPRAGTEVHGCDAALAVRLLLSGRADNRSIWEASDLLVDRRDLLSIVQSLTGSTHRLPDRAATSGRRLLDDRPLRALGWSPGGRPLLERTVARLLDPENPGADR